MPLITVLFQEPGAPPVWGDLADRLDVYDLMGRNAPPISAAIVIGGMESGLPAVTFRIELPDGRTVLAETSGRAICALAAAIRGRCPEVDA